ncbi:aldose epimerase family protein [Niabella sp. 22666]|uniref:aldose epimerase family protein n=1 Tax=Niabella sp. 22666 TaxID=3453954 RepID=UPI003F83EDF1
MLTDKSVRRSAWEWAANLIQTLYQLIVKLIVYLAWMKIALPPVSYMKAIVRLSGIVMCMLFTITVSAQKSRPVYLNPPNFEKEVNGKKTGIAFLSNKKGMQVAITNYGARLVSAVVPDKNGKPVDIVVGFNSIDEYINAKGRNYGATVGRYANRMAKGQFTLDGTIYQLPLNNNGNNLHGGPMGFNEQVWDWVKVSDKAITLAYWSKDGENGFPGNLKVTLTFSLSEQNELKIAYAATTDKKTVLNLTNHSYFNLEGGGNVTGYIVSVNADQYTPVNEAMLPTGEIASVTGTPFDLRKPTIVSALVDLPNQQLQYGGGFDHNFVLNKRKGTKTPELAATAFSPKSGITMKVFTTEPGIQFFTANTLKGLDKDRNGNPINAREAFCFETQHFPDSPNHPNFPTTVLKPGEKFESVTVYQLEVK